MRVFVTSSMVDLIFFPCFLSCQVQTDNAQQEQQISDLRLAREKSQVEFERLQTTNDEVRRGCMGGSRCRGSKYQRVVLLYGCSAHFDEAKEMIPGNVFF